MSKVRTGSLLGIGVSFAFSIQRYFPDTVITSNKLVYAMVVAGIMLPAYGIGKSVTNREIIEMLDP